MSHAIDVALWLAGSGPGWVHAALDGPPVQNVVLQLGVRSGGVISLSHLATREPGIFGDWTVRGDDFELTLSAGYHPTRQGWVLSADLALFEDGLLTQRVISASVTSHQRAERVRLGR